jgi:hypothetical protein
MLSNLTPYPVALLETMVAARQLLNNRVVIANRYAQYAREMDCSEKDALLAKSTENESACQ